MPSQADSQTGGLEGSQQEMEIMAGRRAFATAQQLLAGGPISGIPPRQLAIGWHDSTVNPEQGSFAVVQQNAGLDDLVGEIVSIAYAGVIVYAYVLATADVPAQLSVCRRVFVALNRLTLVSIPATVRPVQQA